MFYGKRERGRRKVQEILSIKSTKSRDFLFLRWEEELKDYFSIIVMIIDLSELNISDYEIARRKINSMK